MGPPIRRSFKVSFMYAPKALSRSKLSLPASTSPPGWNTRVVIGSAAR